MCDNKLPVFPFPYLLRLVKIGNGPFAIMFSLFELSNINLPIGIQYSFAVEQPLFKISFVSASIAKGVDAFAMKQSINKSTFIFAVIWKGNITFTAYRALVKLAAVNGAVSIG